MKKLISLILFLVLLTGGVSASAELNTDRFLSYPDNSMSDGSVIFGLNDMMSRSNGTPGGLMLMIYSEIGYEDELFPIIMVMFGADSFTPISGTVLTDTRSYSILDTGTLIGLPAVDPLTNMIVNKDMADMFRDMATSNNVRFTLMANGMTYDFELTDVQLGQLQLIADVFDEEILPILDEDSEQYNAGLAAYLKLMYPTIAVSGRTYEPLQKGSKGDEVRALQTALIELGYLTGAADGDFGNGTMAAVKAFQEAEGLEPTGVADHETQLALFTK